WIACPLTFYCICLTLVVFRSPDLERAGVTLHSVILFAGKGPEEVGAWKLWVVLGLAVIHWINFRGILSHWWRRGPDSVFAVAYGCVAATVLLFIPQHYTPFIYFQF
ncbi:MAG TPA: hypothetical protein VIS74_05585, partial [Chthoniobacterales bacterium]